MIMETENFFQTQNGQNGSLSGELTAIVAMGRNNEIGFRGDMPWHIAEDLRHFKQVTLGHPVIMGRATWQSLPRRPLPGRRNIVLTRDAAFSDTGAGRAGSVEEALLLCDGEPKSPFIIGGGKVYAAAMPLLTRLEVTRIDADFPGADTFFPAIDPEEWELREVSDTLTSVSGLKFRFESYERRIH